jgi:hypothetical protein
VDQESKQHPKESKSLEFKWLLTFSALVQALIRKEASQRQQDSALNHTSGSQLIWVKNGFQY